ncbi:hypothetical protein [Citricoccus sp.]|uniref:hypothetical protein n=1 Tax=Citricoccus sp. TaxID=1978372 RepID=UPI0028BD4BFE|nr:hypothetical protein [Citricoccus sp.]
MTATDEPGVWSVRNRDVRHGVKGSLLTFTKMADRANAETTGAYSPLNRLKRHDGVGGKHLWDVARSAQRQLMEDSSEGIAMTLVGLNLLIPAIPTAQEAASITQRIFTESVLPVDDEASLYLVEVSDHLGYRYTAARMLLATKNNVSAATFKAEGMVTRSSKGLFPDTSMGLNAYLTCMCACLSPAIWAYPVGRPGGVVLLLFGRARAGQERISRDELHLLAPGRNVAEETPSYPADRTVYVRAAQWWVGQLDTLFSIVTEPANYVSDGMFDTAQAAERLLAVEQIFRDCQSILTQTQDDHARITLAFTLLKRLEGIFPGYDWKKVVGRTSLEGLVRTLRTDVPAELHGVFLWRAERGVRAIALLEDGFFAPAEEEQGKVPLPDKQGVLIEYERKTAVTEWLQLVRNSLHGFDKPSPRDRALLAAHDGNIPGDFADVAWLHILDIVTHPEKLAKFEHLDKNGESSRRR